jgi:pyruvate kinase
MESEQASQLNVKKLVKTKIVCTLGPASTSPEMIEKMIVAGMDIVRLNFSHGDHEDFRRTFNTVCQFYFPTFLTSFSLIF